MPTQRQQTVNIPDRKQDNLLLKQILFCTCVVNSSTEINSPVKINTTGTIFLHDVLRLQLRTSLGASPPFLGLSPAFAPTPASFRMFLVPKDPVDRIMNDWIQLLICEHHVLPEMSHSVEAGWIPRIVEPSGFRLAYR